MTASRPIKTERLENSARGADRLRPSSTTHSGPDMGGGIHPGGRGDRQRTDARPARQLGPQRLLDPGADPGQRRGGIVHKDEHLVRGVGAPAIVQWQQQGRWPRLAPATCDLYCRGCRGKTGRRAAANSSEAMSVMVRDVAPAVRCAPVMAAMSAGDIGDLHGKRKSPVRWEQGLAENSCYFLVSAGGVAVA